MDRMHQQKMYAHYQIFIRSLHELAIEKGSADVKSMIGRSDERNKNLRI
jgi:hypothetical protein